MCYVHVPTPYKDGENHVVQTCTNKNIKLKSTENKLKEWVKSHIFPLEQVKQSGLNFALLLYPKDQFGWDGVLVCLVLQ